MCSLLSQGFAFICQLFRTENLSLWKRKKMWVFEKDKFKMKFWHSDSETAMLEVLDLGLEDLWNQDCWKLNIYGPKTKISQINLSKFATMSIQEQSLLAQQHQQQKCDKVRMNVFTQILSIFLWLLENVVKMARIKIVRNLNVFNDCICNFFYFLKYNLCIERARPDYSPVLV